MKIPINFSDEDSSVKKPTKQAEPIVNENDCDVLDGEKKKECIDKTNPKGHFEPALSTEEERFKMMFGKGSGGSVNQMDKLK